VGGFRKQQKKGLGVGEKDLLFVEKQGEERKKSN